MRQRSEDRAIAFAVPTGDPASCADAVPVDRDHRFLRDLRPGRRFGDSSAPTLRIVGYQVFACTDGFTTLTFQPPRWDH